jgi:Ca2+-transporting ATPase
VLLGHEVEALDEAGLRSAVKEVAVYARIAPEHKLRVVRALQSNGEVVAVTGDGVNDAPALKEAAIGVAMGETGTDVAKEAAGMVLGDDNFATIAVAVREGRKLFENLRKAVRYYLAAKVALVASALLAVLAHLPVPFAPVQIILLEFFMDLGASITFTAEPAESDVMARPPRDFRQPFVDRAMQLGIFGGGISLSAAVIAAYLWAFSRGVSAPHAQTLAFATWMFGHVALAIHMRTERQPLVFRGPYSNVAMVIWGVAAVAVLALVVDVPVLTETLKATPLTGEDWLVALLTPLVTTSWWEAWKLGRWRKWNRVGRKRPDAAPGI